MARFKSVLTICAAILIPACGGGETPPVETPASVEQTTGASEALATSAISVTRTGNRAGRTVILIPGLASSAAVWDETRASLEPDYDVRTVQVAGFSGAMPIALDGNYTDAIADSLIADLQATPGKDTVLVGHSMGGFVSMKTALAAPDLINELVIVDSLPFLSGLFNPATTPELAATQGQFMATQMASLPREAFDAQQAAGVGRLVKTQSYMSTIIDWGKTSDQATVAKAMGELVATDLRGDLAELEQDTLVMMPWDAAMGVSKDQALGLYEAQYAAAPNARVETFDNAFHFIMVDQKEAFLESLKSALAD